MVDRLPCQRSSATARKNWNPQLSANSNCLNSIRNRIWNHNSDRFYLIQTRISRIKHSIVLAESNLAIDCRLELMRNRMTNCIRRIILQAPSLQLAILENSEMNVCCHSEWIACKKYWRIILGLRGLHVLHEVRADARDMPRLEHDLVEPSPHVAWFQID